MERISCLHEKRHAFLSCKLCLRKQLDVLGEKEKKMFDIVLASIEDLKRLEQGVFESVRALNVIKASELMANPFDDLFNLFSLSTLASFTDIPQFSGLLLG